MKVISPYEGVYEITGITSAKTNVEKTAALSLWMTKAMEELGAAILAVVSAENTTTTRVPPTTRATTTTTTPPKTTTTAPVTTTSALLTTTPPTQPTTQTTTTTSTTTTTEQPTTTSHVAADTDETLAGVMDTLATRRTASGIALKQKPWSDRLALMVDDPQSGDLSGATISADVDGEPVFTGSDPHWGSVAGKLNASPEVTAQWKKLFALAKSAGLVVTVTVGQEDIRYTYKSANSLTSFVNYPYHHIALLGVLDWGKAVTIDSSTEAKNIGNLFVEYVGNTEALLVVLGIMNSNGIMISTIVALGNLIDAKGSLNKSDYLSSSWTNLTNEVNTVNATYEKLLDPASYTDYTHADAVYAINSLQKTFDSLSKLPAESDASETPVIPLPGRISASATLIAPSRSNR
jgi:hypothetical protein